MSDHAIEQGKYYAEDFVRQKRVCDTLEDEDSDAVHGFLYEQGELTDPETKEEILFDQPYWITKRTTLEIGLAGGGPAIRILVTCDEDNDPISNTLQWQDWFEPWTDVEVTPKQQNAIDWYVQHLGIDIYLEGGY